MNPDTSEPRKFSPVAQAHHQRRVAAGSNDDVGLVRVDSQQREGALEALAGQLHGLGQAAVGDVPAQLVPEDVRQQRGSNLGVGLGQEGHALVQQFELELGEVLDDAVVDQGQLAAVGQVRVRVPVRGAAVGGPAGVADTGQGLRQRVLLQLGNQVAQLPGLLPRLDHAIGDHGDARRVITAVLQPAKPLKDHVQSAVTTNGAVNRTAYIPHDSTHKAKNIGFRCVACNPDPDLEPFLHVPPRPGAGSFRYARSAGQNL